jgi:hypothetical protein
MVAAVVVLLLRNYLRDFPGNPIGWLEEIIRAVMA